MPATDSGQAEGQKRVFKLPRLSGLLRAIREITQNKNAVLRDALQIIIRKANDPHYRTLRPRSNRTAMERYNCRTVAILTLPDVMTAIYSDKPPSTDIEDGLHLLWSYVLHSETLTAFA